MNRFFTMCTAAFMAILLASCGVSNPLQPQLADPELLSFTEDKTALDNGQYLYKQEISVTNPQLGNMYAYQIETYNSSLPENCFADEAGWLYFPNPGVESNLPLSEPGNHRTIWTSASNLKAEFESTEGKVSNLITHIKVQVKDDKAKIINISSPFKSNRIVSSRIVSPALSGEECGTGVEFVMQEIVGDIFVDGIYADHFMYRLNILDSQLQVIEPGNWLSSIYSPDIRRLILNSETSPALEANQPNQFTQFESYVVSRMGIEEATHQTVYFKAVSGNYPVALIYPETVAGLGQHHYSITNEDPMTVYELIPSPHSHKNRRLFSWNNTLEAINSDDFKLHLRWGYRGQYGSLANHTIIITNNSWDNEIDTVQNPGGGNYHCRIVAFDLRLDGEPLSPLSSYIAPEVVQHNDGTQWLRVQNINDTARHRTFGNLANGNHVFEVCAVDLQGKISNPASTYINLLPYKSPSQRSGILVVDDTVNNASISPELVVDNFYTSVTPESWGANGSFETYTQPSGLNFVSPTQMQNYKAVLWHNDNASSNGTIALNTDALELYFAGGGNLVISGTHKLARNFADFANYQDFLANRLGIVSSDQYEVLSTSLATNPFFVEAEGLNGLGDISLNLETPFTSIVANRQGLSAVTYFNPGTLNYLYNFGCKPIDAAIYPPSQEQYNLYSNKFVAYKHLNATGKVIVFGFPLSYMNQTEVATSLQSVFAELLGGSYAKGGRP